VLRSRLQDNDQSRFVERAPPSLLRCELAAVGYREIAFHPLTGGNAYLAIFAPPSDESRIRPDAMIACTQ